MTHNAHEFILSVYTLSSLVCSGSRCCPSGGGGTGLIWIKSKRKNIRIDARMGETSLRAAKSSCHGATGEE